MMTLSQIRLNAYEAIEHLRNARAGVGTSDVRENHRTKAGELLSSLPANWWRRLPDSESDQIANQLGLYA